MGDTKVLVVGAGPVGLTMACELLRHGVSCRVIDKVDAPQIWSKAAAVQARTMEVFQDMGLVDKVLASGRPMYGANIYNGTKRIAHVDMAVPDTPYGYIFGMSQRTTELLLADHLRALGLELERPVELTGFETKDGGVSATLEHPDGSTEVVEVDWLIGCDGAKSTVRHGLGLPFEGSTFSQSLVQADIKVKFPFPCDPNEAVTFTSEHGPLGALPLLDEGRYRLIAVAPPDPDAEPTLELFQQIVRDRAPEGVEVSDPAWMVKFHFHGRIVPSYRQGRVFLAGDAGHIHSPVGGQGMNLGIQDAYNLAWKLALVVRGVGRESILDSYDVERRPVGQAVVSTTDRATKGMLRVMTLRSPLAQAVRNQTISFLFHSGVMQNTALRGLGGMNVEYGGSPIVGEHHTSLFRSNVALGDGEQPNIASWYAFHRGPGPGQRVPDVHLDDPNQTTLFELLRGRQHVLLLFDGVADTTEGYERMAAIADRVERRYGDDIRIYAVVPSTDRPAALPESLAVLQDPDMTLHDQFGSGTESLYLIRPDGYVGFRSQPAEPDPLFRYLEHIFVS